MNITWRDNKVRESAFGGEGQAYLNGEWHAPSKRPLVGGEAIGDPESLRERRLAQLQGRAIKQPTVMSPEAAKTSSKLIIIPAQNYKAR